VRLTIAQINLLVGDIQANSRRVIERAQQARDQFGADAIVFPELTLTGYPPEDLLLRPHLHAQVERAIEAISRAADGIDIIFGAPQPHADGLGNMALWAHDGRVAGRYRKQRLPNYSVFDEMRYFTAGRESCVVDIAGVPVALSLCEDLWQPGVMEQAVAAGARLMISLNASPFHVNKRAERLAMMRQRISEGGVPLVYVNLVGGQDELVFDGDSFVLAADGNVRHQLPPFVETLRPVDIDITPAGAVNIAPGECVPAPGAEAAVYQALVLGVRDYIQKNGFPGVVIGLSGGIDSALTLAIAVDAIGAEHIEAVMMPSRYTAQISLDDARAEAESLGVNYRQISIEPVFESFLDCLRDAFAGTAADTTEENIQARCRGVILMAISNKKGYIVLTTGNKSEMSVGYATLYGDMAGGFAPIKDVPKTLVYRLARYINDRSTRGDVIPERVLVRPPSAELAPEQKDEDSLPAYAILDPILEQYIELDRDPEAIVRSGYDADVVARVVQMVNRNEYKRRQAPPGVRITRRAFGRDRRYPITSGYHEHYTDEE
jgi:NAD+ synthase (glutamine-hydrolysing)